MAENKFTPPPTKSFVTPKGTFKFPHLTEADFGTDAYPIVNGEFNLRLVMDAAGLDSLKASMADFLPAAKEYVKAMDAKRKPPARDKSPLNWSDVGSAEYDKEDSPTGNFEVKIKTAASGKNKKTGKVWNREVLFIDAKRQPFKPDSVWGGITGRVKVTARAYFVEGSGAAGISLFLELVQIIDLVAAGGSAANTDGFDDEDGFEAPAGGFADEPSKADVPSGSEEPSDF